MLRCFSKVLLLGLCVSLVGCATLGKHNFVKKRETEYLRSQSAPALQIPAGLSSAKVGDDYQIPATPSTVPTQPIGLLPPDSLADQIATGKVSRDVLKHSNKVGTGQITNAATANAGNTANTAVANTQGNLELPLNRSAAESWKPMIVALNHMGYRVVVQDQPMNILYILDTPATQYKATKATAIYQVHLQDNANGSSAYVTDSNGKPINQTIAARILKDISEGLAGKSVASPLREWEHIKTWAKEAVGL